MVPNIQIFEKTISAYMLAALAGVLVILFVMRKIAEKNGIDELNVQNMILISFIGVVIGGRLFSAIGHYERILYFINNFSEIRAQKRILLELSNVFSSAAFYGGLIGAILCSWIYLKAKKLDFGPYTDIGAMAIPLFHTFGRIGCFLSGCCYGIESKFGFVYHYSVVAEANGVRRFPVQLVEALFNLCLFLLIYYLFTHLKFRNRLLIFYLMAYSAARFLLEFLRGDDYRGFVGVLSSLQVCSIVIFAVTAASLLIINSKNKKASEIE